MARRLALSPLLLVVPIVWAVPALAAAPGAGKPSITITSPHNGATIHGGTVTVHVAVSNFKLVPPVYVNPPLLRGNQGHIHYVLDSLAHFVATRDARIALSHTWTNVSPGPHTLIAYLATSQHALFPGTRRVSVHVLVTSAEPAGGAAAHPSTHAVKPHAVKTVKGLATTGGGAGENASRLDLPATVAGLICLLLGAFLLWTGRLRTHP